MRLVPHKPLLCGHPENQMLSVAGIVVAQRLASIVEAVVESGYFRIRM